MVERIREHLSLWKREICPIVVVVVVRQKPHHIYFIQ